MAKHTREHNGNEKNCARTTRMKANVRYCKVAHLRNCEMVAFVMPPLASTSTCGNLCAARSKPDCTNKAITTPAPNAVHALFFEFFGVCEELLGRKVVQHNDVSTCERTSCEVQLVKECGGKSRIGCACDCHPNIPALAASMASSRSRHSTCRATRQKVAKGAIEYNCGSQNKVQKGALSFCNFVPQSLLHDPRLVWLDECTPQCFRNSTHDCP